MSANYSPWETSESAGADLTGTMTADRASGPSYTDVFGAPASPQAAPAPQGGGMPDFLSAIGGGVQSAAGTLGAFQAAKQAAKAQEAPPFKSLTMKADGTFKAEGDQSMLADVMAQLKDLQTMKTAAMARVAQLKQQESSGSPILDALSQFAGNMAANDPTMPGWVRALGATNLQMGPQGIKRERMLEEQRALGISKEIAGTSLEAAKLQDEQQQRALAEQQRAETIQMKAAKDKDDAFFKAHDDAYNMITNSGEFDPRATARKMFAVGIPQEQIAAELEDLQSYADARKAYLEAKEAKAEDKELRRLAAIANAAGARVDATDRRIQAREEAELRGREHSFKMKVLSESKPSAVVDTSLREASQALDTIEKAKTMLADPEIRKKFGFGKGWLATRKPFRGSEEQRILSIGIDTLSEAAKAAGLKPLSDTDLRLLKEGIFDPNKSPEANDEVVRQLETKVKNLVTQIMEYNRSVDWAAKADGLPKFTRSLIPRLMERRKAYFSEYAPAGVEIPETPFNSGPAVPAGLEDLAEGKQRRVGGKLYANIPGRGITEVVERK